LGVYQFSRAIYRELADEILEDRRCESLHNNHERVLRACEATVQRLATDRHYFARPARSLFCDIRIYFPMSSQRRVYNVIDSYMSVADEYLKTAPRNGFDICGNPLRCRASTRKGTPCQRAPLAANGYCPSHQHLAESEELAA
jgi:hypothetical protein